VASPARGPARRPQNGDRFADLGPAVEEPLAVAREGGSGRPVPVNVWLDKTACREGSLSM